MQRRRFLTTATALSLGAGLSPLLARSAPPASPDFKMIRGGVGYYTNRGGTMGYYVPADRELGTVVVDSQFPEEARTFARRMVGERLDLLINTHHHGDHTGGNGVFAPLAANYVAHARAKTNLETKEAQREQGDPLPLPTTTFAEDWSMTISGGEEIVTARHFGPAHTGGDAVIHFENADVAHLGDLLFNRRFPYLDTAAGGDILNWAPVMKKIRKHYGKDTVYLFGHAAESYAVTGNQNDLRAFENYLNQLRKYVRREKKNGTPLEALQAKTVTVPNAPEWRSGERMRNLNLSAMYEALD